MISGFPNISLNDILELEFQLSYNMHIPFEFDNKEFYEFIFLYERLVQERKNENEREAKANGRQNLMR